MHALTLLTYTKDYSFFRPRYFDTDMPISLSCRQILARHIYCRLAYFAMTLAAYLALRLYFFYLFSATHVISFQIMSADLASYISTFCRLFPAARILLTCIFPLPYHHICPRFHYARECLSLTRWAFVSLHIIIFACIMLNVYYRFHYYFIDFTYTSASTILSL